MYYIIFLLISVANYHKILRISLYIERISCIKILDSTFYILCLNYDLGMQDNDNCKDCFNMDMSRNKLKISNHLKVRKENEWFTPP